LTVRRFYVRHITTLFHRFLFPAFLPTYRFPIYTGGWPEFYNLFIGLYHLLPVVPTFYNSSTTTIDTDYHHYSGTPLYSATDFVLPLQITTYYHSILLHSFHLHHHLPILQTSIHSDHSGIPFTLILVFRSTFPHTSTIPFIYHRPFPIVTIPMFHSVDILYSVFRLTIRHHLRFTTGGLPSSLIR